MEVNDIVKEVSSSKKYKDLVIDVVKKIAERYKDLDKVKAKLHQIWGAYYSTRPDFNKLFKKLENKEISIEDILRIHSSTKERLGEYKEIYEFLWESCHEINVIEDIGCGLNPLFFLLLPKKWDIYYYVDIDLAQQKFLEKVFEINKRNDFKVITNDLRYSADNGSNDLVLLLKLLPVLDQQAENGAQEVIKIHEQKKYLAVSFPNKSLGGREKGMKENYYEKYIPLISNNGFDLVGSKAFSNEVLYIFRNKNRT